MIMDSPKHAKIADKLYSYCHIRNLRYEAVRDKKINLIVGITMTNYFIIYFYPYEHFNISINYD